MFQKIHPKAAMNRMGQVIKNPNEIVEPLIDDLETVFGARLIGVCMYGDAVSHEYVPGKSPVNLLIILSDTSVAMLHKGVTKLRQWVKRGITSPLFLSPDDFLSYAKEFPVEILSIKQLYRVLSGEDIISTVSLRKDDLHSQCLRELRGMAVHLRREYIAAEKPARLEEIMQAVVTTLLPVFKAVLIVFDKKIPHGRTEIIAAVEDLFGMGSSILSKIYNCKRFNRKDVHSWYDQLTITVDTIISETAELKVVTSGKETVPEMNQVPSL